MNLGDKAYQIISNEAYTKAFTDMQRQYIEDIVNSEPLDVEGREKSAMMLKLLSEFHGLLTNYVKRSNNTVSKLNNRKLVKG